MSLRTLIAALAVAGIALVATPARAEPMLAVIVAPQHADVGYSAAQLALIYQRKHVYWPDGRRIEPVNLPLLHPLRRTFSLAILKLEPAALDDYWNGQYFHGVRPPYVLASAAAVLRFVAQTPGAIGYLDRCDVDDSVAIIGVIDSGYWRATRTPPPCAGSTDTAPAP